MNVIKNLMNAVCPRCGSGRIKMDTREPNKFICKKCGKKFETKEE